jgi:hypothetical protein
MFDQDETLRVSVEQTLLELDNDPFLHVELSSADLIEVVGGAYAQALRKSPSGAKLTKTPALTLEDNCGPGSCHAACNSWCHDWTPER